MGVRAREVPAGPDPPSPDPPDGVVDVVGCPESGQCEVGELAGGQGDAWDGWDASGGWPLMRARGMGHALDPHPR